MGFLGPVTQLGRPAGPPARHRDLHRARRRRIAAERHPAAADRLRGARRVRAPAASEPWVQLTRGQADALEPRGPAGAVSAARVGARDAMARLVTLGAKDAGVQISAKTDYAIRALLSLAAREPELVKVDVVVDRAGAAPQVRRGDPRRAAPRRPGPQPARRRRRLRAGPAGRRDHAGRGHPRRRRAAGGGPRAAPARDDVLRRRRAPARGLGRGAGRAAPGARRDDAGPGADRQAARARAQAGRRPRTPGCRAEPSIARLASASGLRAN